MDPSIPAHAWSKPVLVTSVEQSKDTFYDSNLKYFKIFDGPSEKC